MLPTDTHSVILEGEEWIIPSRYQLKELLGIGSYGCVASAYDRKTGCDVAIKKNKNIFPKYLNVSPSKSKKNKTIVPTNRSCISQLRVLREVSILNFIDHPNLLSMKQVIIPPSYDEFSDVYIVSEIMDADLRDVLDSGEPVGIVQIKYLMWQLCNALAYLHDCDIMHRDIKPENILVNSKCELRLCDFGLARGCDFNAEPMFEAKTRLSTNYVQTRPYRAPELLLNCPHIGKSSDMWAVGCILAELLNNGQALFDGTDTQDQLVRIVQLMGTPQPDALHSSRAGIKFMNDLEFVQSNPEWYFDVFPRHEFDIYALDLMSKLLQFDCEKRISAREALSHPFFTSLNVTPHPYKARKYNFDFEKNLVVQDDDNVVITYGSLVKRVCYDTILLSHGVKVQAETTGIAPPKKKSILTGIKDILTKRKVFS